MKAWHMSKPCCAAVLALVGLSSLLVWFTYWSRRVDAVRTPHAETWIGQLEAFDNREYLMWIQQSNKDINRVPLNLQHFMERRNKTISKVKVKKNRKGKVFRYKSSKVSAKSTCVPFRTMVNYSRICVHSKLHDQFISSHIRDMGSWEPDLLAAMATALSSSPDMHLLDVGCNVGTFAMYAALMGRKVVAIDPIRSNLFMLHSSLVYAGIRDNAILLLNAISDYAEPVRVLINEQNLGGSRVKPVTGHVDGNDVIVDAIVMDDLVNVLNFKKVFVKIDIEGYEPNAFRRASRFFKTFDVRYILMEWMFLRHSSSGHEIIDFLTSRGFHPFADILNTTPLDVKTHSTWPDNMIWYKRRTGI